MAVIAPTVVMPASVRTGYHADLGLAVCRPDPERCMGPEEPAFPRYVAVISEGFCPGCFGRLRLLPELSPLGDQWLVCPTGREWLLVWP